MSLSDTLASKLRDIEDRYVGLETSLADPEIIADGELYLKTAKEHADLAPLVDAFRAHRETEARVAESRELLDDQDPELAELAAAEVADGETRLGTLEERMNLLLLPKDPHDDKNVILELRAGRGGRGGRFSPPLSSACICASPSHRWQVEMMNSHETDGAATRKWWCSTSATGLHQLKYEYGVHGQRVPAHREPGTHPTSA